jgi:RNA polymerase-binding transcription factor DksA
MSSTLMPTPDRRRPELTANLRLLRENLEAQRRFHLRQLAELDGRRPFSLGGYGRGDDDLLADAARRTLGDIETALNRMRTHRYGVCLYCGAEIPLDRLRAVPQIDACPTCER